MTEMIFVRSLTLLLNLIIPIGMILVAVLLRTRIKATKMTQVVEGEKSQQQHYQIFKRFCMGTGIIVIIGIVLFINVSLPFLKDCIYILQNGIPTVEGTLTSDYYYGSSTSVKENVVIITDDGQELELFLEASNWERGDYVVVRYLPYSKDGEIINR